MGLNGGSIYVAFDMEIIVLSNDVVYAFVHGADVVAVEFDILFVGDDVYFRFTEAAAVFVIIEIVEFLPRYVAERNDAVFFTLNFEFLSLIFFKFSQIGQGIVELQIRAIGALEIIFHISAARIVHLRGGTGAAADLSAAAAGAGD